MVHLPFADRLEAGRLLADQLSLYKVAGDAVVLAALRPERLSSILPDDRPRPAHFA